MQFDTLSNVDDALSNVDDVESSTLSTTWPPANEEAEKVAESSIEIDVTDVGRRREGKKNVQS